MRTVTGYSNRFHAGGLRPRPAGVLLLGLAVVLAGCGEGKGSKVAGPTSVTAALVTVDPSTGTGFVGKGDVQLVFGWNNAQLQANAASVQFRSNSVTVTERSWVCTNSNNQHTQERERTTTTTTVGLVSNVARVRNQVTGFNLTGYTGAPPTPAVSTDGPPLNSCPSGPWSLTSPAGAPVVVSQTDGLEVSIDGVNWFPI